MLQNRHPRVHVSPINMIVAVAADLLLPPQQSEILGHRASSHTVCKFKPRRSFLIFLYDELSGMGVLSHSGRRVICFCLPFGPTRAVFKAYASEGCSGGSLPETNSVNEGPALSLSAKEVGRIRGLVVGMSSVVVANVRVEDAAEVELEVRNILKGEDQGRPWRQR